MKAVRWLACLLLALFGACLPLAGAPAADRGIGGTGAPYSGPGISDRGIGGTGIVGVITGFGSVFVNGLEVAYTPTTPLTVDGESEPGAELRVGQLASIVASDDNGLNAISIDVRHEVSGPVTSVDPDGRIFVVAGQAVAIDSGTDGLQAVHPGDWVAVSGIREPDGVIAASRIDERTPGTVLVRGPVARRAAGWRIGDLAVSPLSRARLAPGASITARGTLENGTLSVATAAPDVLSSDPGAFFGGRVRRIVIESYVSAANGHVRLGHGWRAAPGRGIVVPAGSHRAIVELERGAHGDFVATHLRNPGRPFAPRLAPVAPGRRGSLGPLHPGSFHPGPHAFGPAHFERHPWQDRPRGFGRGGRGFGRGGRMRGGRG